MAMLEVRDLEVYYGVIQAIKGISFDVNQGEIIALIGANGAGKTTILHTVTGLIPSKAGRITYEGTDITKMAGHKLVPMGIAHVPEGRRVFAQLSVLQNLKLGAFTRNDKAEMEETLKMIYRRFPKTGRAEKPDGRNPFRRRAADACHGTGADEPPKAGSNGRAVHGTFSIYVNEIFDIIQKINEDGVTVLLVEQNAKKALSIANRAYVLETGNIVLGGDANQLMNDDRVKKAYLSE